MFSYLKFWIKSSNQHGLHSPFVYNYLTKGLYETKQISKNKQLNWILKTINYFKPDFVYVFDSLKPELVKLECVIFDSISNADLIFIKDYSLDKVNAIVDELKSEQLLFICNSEYDANFQNELRQNDKIVLVVDFYVGSLISKRTEQLKQNFFLRL